MIICILYLKSRTECYTTTTGLVANIEFPNLVWESSSSLSLSTIWKNMYTAQYLPKLKRSVIYIEFDTPYLVGNTGSMGVDSISSRILISNVQSIMVLQQQWSNTQGSGTRSGVLFPIRGKYQNDDGSQISIYIQALGPCDDPIITDNIYPILQVTEIAI